MQSVPAMRPVEKDCDALGDRVFNHDGGYDVFSWSPGKADEKVASTQVHLVLPVVPGVRVALRLKSTRALDELVGVLLQHRRDVWGDG